MSLSVLHKRYYLLKYIYSKILQFEWISEPFLFKQQLVNLENIYMGQIKSVIEVKK